MEKISVGSVCSGIEAASIAFENLNFSISWFSEIANFPSSILKERYPNIPNLGDMSSLPHAIRNHEINAPDFICGGTPCQAFSLAGWKKGLEDDRGNLTLKFVDIIDSNDDIRKSEGKTSTIVLWENVEGVLTDKTNPFGCFLSSLLGLENELKIAKWASAGTIHGPKRNVAWRVLDAKYFGLPHQRRRLYVIAGGTDFFPENVLFDKFPVNQVSYEKISLKFKKNGNDIQIFRGYTDCLYSSYGTKWNGNAAAYNGSLFIVQNKKIRRLTPLECERLMGFPDNYTYTEKCKLTNRYQALGNSWAIPVIKWIGERLETEILGSNKKSIVTNCEKNYITESEENFSFFKIPTNLSNQSQSGLFFDNDINGSEIPECPIIGDMQAIIDTQPDKKLYISPVGCYGILRRKEERNIKINKQLEDCLIAASSSMPQEEIEIRSRVQKRGKFSTS